MGSLRKVFYMPRTSFKDIDCPVAQGAEIIGDKWKFLVLRNAFFGMTRYDDFLKSLNISSKVLSIRLAEMVNDGILTKETSNLDRRAKLYSLTAKGKDLLTFIISLAQWSERWAQEDWIRIVAKDGKPIERIALRSYTGKELQHGEVSVIHGKSKSAELNHIREIVATRG